MNKNNPSKKVINKKVILLCLLVLIILIISITSSLAYFAIYTNQSSNNKLQIAADCLDIEYNEVQEEGLNINYPITDEYAEENVKPIEVTIKNKCTNEQAPIGYTLALTTLGDNNIIESGKIRYKVDKQEGEDNFNVFKVANYLSNESLLATGNKLYEELNRDLLKKENTKNLKQKETYLIDTDQVESNSENKYKIYLWIDYYEGDSKVYEGEAHNPDYDNTTKNQTFKSVLSLVVNLDDDLLPGVAGDGTASNPYKINYIEDLVELSNKVNSGKSYSRKNIELLRDLDFNSKSSYKNPNTTIYGDINNNDIEEEGLLKELTTGDGFIPIGSESHIFMGNFDGNKHILSNLHIENDTAEARLGLFGAIQDSSLKNLTVTGNIRSTMKAYMGGLAALVYGTSSIDTTYSKVNIFGNSESSVGGIVGWNSGAPSYTGFTTITNSHNEGSISGGNAVGGIVANSTGDLIIEECSNTGTLNGSDITSGIVGFGWGYHTYILNSYNTGTITGARPSGIALEQSGTIAVINSYNAGNIIVDGQTNKSNGLITIFPSATYNTVYLNNVYNIGNAQNAIGNFANISEIKSLKNAYYPNNQNGTNISDLPVTPMPLSDMKSTSFVNTLNSNKSSINLTSIDSNLAEYTLRSWTLGSEGYPILVSEKIEDLSGNNNDGIPVNIAKWDSEGITTSDDNTKGWIDAGLKNYDFKNTLSYVVRVKVNKLHNNASALIGNWSVSPIAGGGFALNQSGALYYNQVVVNKFIIMSYSNPYSLNQFHTIVFTYDGKTASLYLDGVKSIYEYNADFVNSPKSVLIGIAPSYLPYTREAAMATFSDALVFDRVLTEEEVKQNYIGVPNPVNKQDLLLWYKFTK